ncbi:hypothetical protein ABW20_dc0100971 [Dactylellina cionopaga]|nr:hypothetical protein ABW20_dc0100971 [Dactylellina cionopaga]
MSPETFSPLDRTKLSLNECWLDTIPNELHLQILSYLPSWKDHVSCMQAYNRWRGLLQHRSLMGQRYETYTFPRLHRLFSDGHLRILTCAVSNGKITSATISIRRPDLKKVYENVYREEITMLWDLELVGPGVLDDPFLSYDAARSEKFESIKEIYLDFTRPDPEYIFGKPCGHEQVDIEKPNSNHWSIRDIVEFSAKVVARDEHFRDCKDINISFQSLGLPYASCCYFGGSASRYLISPGYL